MSHSSPVPQRVVQVIAPAQFGGAETVVQQLLGELRARSIPTTTVALGVLDPEAHAWVQSLREQRFDVRCTPPSRTREYLELSKVLREQGVATVHSHGYRADFAAFMARRRGVRWISTAHGFTGGGLRVLAYEAMDKWLLRQTDRTLAVSSRLAASLAHRQRSQESVALVRNVPPRTDLLNRAEARAILGLPLQATIVGWVGRFSHEKGADRLPALFADPSTACTLVLFGEGPLREQVVHSLASLSHLDALWMGMRRDIGVLLAAFDLLVLPSRTEGMPMVILESMAAGTPAIAFDVGDVSHAVNSLTGWCVPQDDLRAFSAALIEALRIPSERQKRGEAAIRHARSGFSIQGWTDAHLQAYCLNADSRPLPPNRSTPN